MNTPFRYDFVGSFLRPLSLKEARKQFEAGTISKQELVKVEDACIEDLIAKQKTAGYHVITDGEFRRATWHLDFFWEFNGVGHTKTKTGLPFHGEAAMIDDTYLTGKISYNNNHSFLRHFEFVNQFEDENTVAKLTIPAPAQFLEQMIMPFAWENTSKYYDTQKQVAEDIVKDIVHLSKIFTQRDVEIFSLTTVLGEWLLIQVHRYFLEQQRQVLRKLKNSCLMLTIRQLRALQRIL